VASEYLAVIDKSIKIARQHRISEKIEAFCGERAFCGSQNTLSTKDFRTSQTARQPPVTVAPR
jgi:hypothetical protein